jgi:methylated-DNA-[protein]-cysteine S-methyltransferase
MPSGAAHPTIHVAANSKATYYAYVGTPVGKILLIASENKFRGVYLMPQKHFPKIGKTWIYGEQMRCFRDFKQQLAEYFNGQRVRFDVDHIYQGTPLQKATWRQLQQIPYGTRMGYKALARAANRPHAVRAVATAVGRNPLMLVLPCHRVVHSNGNLGGFSAGLWAKKQLLTLEQGSENTTAHTIEQVRKASVRQS